MAHIKTYLFIVEFREFWPSSLTVSTKLIQIQFDGTDVIF